MRKLISLVISLVGFLTIFASAFFFGDTVHAFSFEDSWSRYPSPDTIIATLKKQFPLAKIDGIYLKLACGGMTDDERTILGDSSPATGAPVIRNPNSSFAVWYLGCVSQYINSERAQLNSAYANSPTMETIEKFVGHKIASVGRFNLSASYSPEYDPTVTYIWSEVDVPTRQEAIIAIIEQLLGPEELIVGMGLAPSMKAFAERLDSELAKTLEKSPKAFTFIGIYSSTLTPLEARRAIQFLILLNDTLKF